MTWCDQRLWGTVFGVVVAVGYVVWLVWALLDQERRERDQRDRD